MSASANPFPSNDDAARPYSSSSLDTPSGAGSSGTASDMMSRVVSGAHHTIDRLAESAAPHVDRLQATGEDLTQRAEHLRHVGDEWTESMRSTVRDNPLAAVAVALALGMLIARVTR
jgi:ElaB/YqjD/DUF883 family membrane-anchored ribosome-binding protein